MNITDVKTLADVYNRLGASTFCAATTDGSISEYHKEKATAWLNVTKAYHHYLCHEVWGKPNTLKRLRQLIVDEPVLKEDVKTVLKFGIPGYPWSHIPKVAFDALVDDEVTKWLMEG